MFIIDWPLTFRIGGTVVMFFTWLILFLVSARTGGKAHITFTFVPFSFSIIALILALAIGIDAIKLGG